jgi:hypothetical protein
MRFSNRVLLVSLFLLGCGEEAGVDAGMDAGPFDAGRDAGHDAGVDAGSLDAGTLDRCVAYADNLYGPDGSAGLAATIGSAIGACAGSTCVQCALDPTRCGSDGSLEGCVLRCIEENDFGSCETAACETGETCDTTPDPAECRNDAASMVNAALMADDVDEPCVGCYAAITQCVVDNGCALECLSPTSCACLTCQCDAGCPAEFSVCSGMPPFIDCAALSATCPP